MKPLVQVLALLALLTFLFAALGAADQTLPADVRTLLDSAGANRSEVEKALTHYGAPADSLKYRAACYLIGNMEGHSYVTYALVDTTGKEIEFSALDYPSYDSLEAAFKVLESRHGSLDFKKKDVIRDETRISSDYLVSQIDYAFRAWTERPWARWLTFDQFCRYVLPYRGSNEPLDPWRESFFNEFADLSKSMKDSTDPIEAARAINKQIMTWFKFDSRYYYHPTDQGLSDMRLSGLGRCEDMTNLAIFAMRANGLAVTSDYTPFWADSSNNHAWNAILTPNGKVVPFMGCEANPGEYNLFHKAAKVYRKTFENHLENLAFQKHKQKKIPGWLAGKSYIDVTSDYTKAFDVTVRIDAPIPDSVDIAYLCVFNTGEWQPIQWGRITGKTATFPAMATGVMYLPAFYLNEEVVPAGPAFVLRDDSSMIPLGTGTDHPPTTVQLLSVGRTKLESGSGGALKSALKPGKEYELFYWADSWKSLGKATATNQPILFSNIPQGYLYRLVAVDSDKEERIFTIDGVMQVWW